MIRFFLVLFFILLYGCGGGNESGGSAVVEFPSPIQSVDPYPNSSNTEFETVITVYFDRQMDASTINTSTFFVTDDKGNPVGGSVDYQDILSLVPTPSEYHAAIFIPSVSLDPSRKYTATTTNGIKDRNGNIGAIFSWSFTVRADTGQGTWKAVSTIGAPAGTGPAIWADTGTNTGMLLWNSWDESISSNDFYKYAPSSDSWFNTLVLPPVLSKRSGHTAIWTGTDMIIWGGYNGTTFFDDGGRYNPSKNSLEPLSLLDAPQGRTGHTAIWTGTEMLIWGGTDGTAYFSDGAKYNPLTGSWRQIASSGAPAARAYHSAVWSGSEMIVWGGDDGTTLFKSGGRYNPVTDTWLPITGLGAPPARSSHKAFWTGTEMIVWGGTAPNLGGGKYNPSANTWNTISDVGAPPIYNNNSMWLGNKLLVWGGMKNIETIVGTVSMQTWTGGLYDPVTNSWSETSVTGAVTGESTVWTGNRLIVWSGSEGALFIP